MRDFLDSSFIIRYLVNDIPAMAHRAAQVIEGGDDLRVTGMALMESAFVLARVYTIPRHGIIDGLIDLVSRDNIVVVGIDKEHVVAGLELCRPSGRVSVADALIWAAARSAGNNTVIYTFDQRFPSDGVELRK